MMRVRHGFARRYAVPGLVVLVVIGSALFVGRPWATWCPTDWGGTSRVDLTGPSGDVMLDGRPYRVGANALLDYMPRALIDPLDFVLYRLRGEHHPLGVTATISAFSRDALGDPAFTCFRVTRGGEIWSRRPTTYPTQTSADGLPPGAPVPSSIEAWRLAVANDGPEWPDGGQITLELWVTVNGGRYVFVLPPIALMRGG
jgi:hypothetical protein